MGTATQPRIALVRASAGAAGSREERAAKLSNSCRVQDIFMRRKGEFMGNTFKRSRA